MLKAKREENVTLKTAAQQSVIYAEEWTILVEPKKFI